MTTCHHCGQDIPERVQWHGLMVTALGEVFWRGVRSDRFTRSEAALLLVLAKRGEATHLALEMACTGSGASLIKVHMSHIRRKLREGRVPIAIRSVHGTGYRLELDEADAGAFPPAGDL